jgi:peptidoglycan hydrolase-like amidase
MERSFKLKKAALLVLLSIVSSVMAPLGILPAAAAQSNPDIPKIISRAEWGADESIMTWPVEYAPVEKIVVHHTASTVLVPDTDGSGQYKDMVNAIYQYHAGKKSWTDVDGTTYAGFGDIGYNYVIDPNGNIYEGRTGGNGVVGGHVTGFNRGSVGISIIGNYQDGAVGQTNTELNDQVKTSLEKLIGWIAANNNIDLNKTSNFYGKGIDGVVGHKDLAATACPGNIIYDQLGAIQTDAALYENSYKQYAYQVSGSDSVYILSGGTKAKYASLSALPSPLQGRTVKTITQSQLNAYQYKDKRIFPDGTLIQAKNDNMVYYIEGGKKRAMSMTGQEFQKMGFKSGDVVAIDASDLDLYANGSVIKYAPDGVLVKDAKNNVYLIENGKKRAFTSAKLFDYLKYNWTKVKADANADLYLAGAAMRYPDGTLMRSATGANVYLMANGTKRMFTSGALFEKLGYKWSSVLTIDAAELGAYAAGANMVMPSGTLIRGAGATTVYLVDSGQKREITSGTLLQKLGYNFSSVVEIPTESLQDYPTGTRAVYPTGTLIKAKGTATVYMVVNGGKQDFASISVFNAVGAKWENVIEISADELGLYATNGFVKYPDGNLIKINGGERVYVMRGGVAVWIQTAAEFAKGGYKWSSVLTLDQSEMKLYVSETPTAITPTTPTDTNSGTDTNTNTNNNANTDTNTNTNTNTGNTSTNVSGAEPNIRIAIMGKYADGSLLKATNGTQVYAVKSGAAVAINSADEFTKAGYSWNDVVAIDPKDLAVVLASNAQDTKITGSGNYKVEYHTADGAVYKTLQKASGDVTDVPFFDWDKYIRFIPESDSVVLQVLSYNDTFVSGTTTYNDNQFRGVIELHYSPTSKKLWTIEDVSVEGYLHGISEATTRTNPEYLKAFAIITRTYAMNYIVKGGKHTGEPFILKNSRNGNGNDQQYKGYNFEMRSPTTASSYDQTRGQVIEYKDKLIVAAYSSDSGGVSKDACSVLSKNYCTDDYAYLRGGVKDPASTVHNAASVAASHGAGLSAAGAHQMGVEGSTWDKIITTYYPGVNIDKYYN